MWLVAEGARCRGDAGWFSDHFFLSVPFSGKAFSSKLTDQLVIIKVVLIGGLCFDARNPSVDALFEHIQRQCTRAKHFIVKPANVEFRAQLGASFLAQPQNC